MRIPGTRRARSNPPAPLPVGSRSEETAPTMADASGPPSTPEPLPWTKGIAPRYIALFLLIVFHDQLALKTLAVGGLAPAALGATIGGVLAFLLLFYTPAMWGLRSHRGLIGIAASTFGKRGSVWLPGALLGVVEVVWFAVTLFYAVDLAFRALSTIGLLDPTHLDPIRWQGLTLAGPLFFWVALAWSIASALIGTLAFRLTAAVMAGYQPFPAIVLGLVAIWAMPGLVGFEPLGYDPETAEAVADPSWFAFLMMVQLVFGFFATFGAMGADWGASSRNVDDVRWGGLVGVAFAATVLATLALLIVAGANGREPSPEGLRGNLATQQRLIAARSGSNLAGTPESAAVAVREVGGRNYSVRYVLQHGLGGIPGGIALIVLSLALLGPACFAPYVIGRRLHETWPVWPRWGWSVAGAVATWPIIGLRWPIRLESIFGVLGALFAPVVGAFAADALRHRGHWPGARQGINPAGWVAWLVGVIVGLVPWVGPALGFAGASRFQPAALMAFGAAFVTYLALAIVGLESRVQPPEVSATQQETTTLDTEATAQAPGQVEAGLESAILPEGTPGQ